MVSTDDILVASTNRVEHEQHLHALHKRLREYCLRIHPAKCVFGVENLDFVGYWVSTQGISPLLQKVKAIKDFPQPSTPNKLHQSLGMVNNYH